MTAELLVLRLIHIFGGIFWVGTSMFTTLFLVPALGTLGPDAGRVMAALQRRKLMIWLPLVALLTILSGVRLLSITSGGFNPVYFGTPMGRAYSMGASAAVLAMLISLVVVRPAAMRSAKLSGELATANDAERAELMRTVGTLRQRGAIFSIVVLLLLAFAASTMAVARYLT